MVSPPSAVPADLLNDMPGGSEPKGSRDEGCRPIALLAVHAWSRGVPCGGRMDAITGSGLGLGLLGCLGGMDGWQAPRSAATIECRLASKPPAEVGEEAIMGDLGKVCDLDPCRIPSTSRGTRDHQPEIAFPATENQSALVG